MVTLATRITEITPDLIQTRAAQFTALWPAAAAKCGKRLARAVELANTEYVTPCADGSTYFVRSATDPDKSYSVNPAAHTCTCPDNSNYAGGIICKHRLAVALLVGWEVIVTTNPPARPAYDHVVLTESVTPLSPRTIVALANIDQMTASHLQIAHTVLVTQINHAISHPAYPESLDTYRHCTALLNAVIDRIDKLANEITL